MRTVTCSRGQSRRRRAGRVVLSSTTRVVGFVCLPVQQWHRSGVKVVLAALPAFGHVYPLVPLAMAWQRAGHEVLMAVGDGLRADLPGRRIPGAEPAWTLADAIVRAEQKVSQHAGMPPPEDMPTVLFLHECAPHVVEVMREQLHREQPDVVVFEQCDLGAAIAAREAGCPGVAVGIV